MTEAPTLAEVVSAVAADLPDAEARREGPTVRWSCGSRAFATLSGSELELRLDPAIAAAAIRTPDTEPSDRGPEWVRFRPTELDGHAVDRARAWFALAYRRARPNAG